jgi:hypothetical protein
VLGDCCSCCDCEICGSLAAAHGIAILSEMVQAGNKTSCELTRGIISDAPGIRVSRSLAHDIVEIGERSRCLRCCASLAPRCFSFKGSTQTLGAAPSCPIAPNKAQGSLRHEDGNGINKRGCRAVKSTLSFMNVEWGENQAVELRIWMLASLHFTI